MLHKDRLSSEEYDLAKRKTDPPDEGLCREVELGGVLTVLLCRQSML